ncbi:hypothetical protein MRX96_040345 [Rhipicephalus microplus]
MAEEGAIVMSGAVMTPDFFTSQFATPVTSHTGVTHGRARAFSGVLVGGTKSPCEWKKNTFWKLRVSIQHAGYSVLSLRGKKREKDCLPVLKQPGDEGVPAKANNVASSSVIHHTEERELPSQAGRSIRYPSSPCNSPGKKRRRAAAYGARRNKKERSSAGKRASRNKRASSASVDGDPDRKPSAAADPPGGLCQQE